jgi:hypothetical protein
MVEENGRGQLAVEGTLRPITGQEIGSAFLDVSLRCGISTRRQSSITFYISSTLIPTNKNKISTSRYFTQLPFSLYSLLILASGACLLSNSVLGEMDQGVFLTVAPGLSPLQGILTFNDGGLGISAGCSSGLLLLGGSDRTFSPPSSTPTIDIDHG